ncbi:universal stress protein [Halorubellus sp. JP-L1]|uniref:universal stress protein n=1 Tax=Halorubellus sp. JP-L1 TaxID=2715753 RepID=UPI0014087923|nr:universal stress protein [Halorubellus sp. JP-L1]NHN43300.1 universal stress protein [Halorubellus sp. JP-L1]
MHRVLLPVHLNVERALSQANFVAGLADEGATVEADVLFVFTGEERSPDTPDEMKRFDSPTRIDAVRRVMEVLDDAGVDYHVRENSGEVAQDIIDDADEIDADQIVIGGRKRSPAGKLLFGSVSQEVLLNTDRPVTVTTAESE